VFSKAENVDVVALNKVFKDCKLEVSICHGEIFSNIFESIKQIVLLRFSLVCDHTSFNNLDLRLPCPRQRHVPSLW